MSVLGINVFDDLKKHIDEYIAYIDSEPAEEVIKKTLLAEIETIKQKIINIKEQEPTGELTTEKFKAMKNLFEANPPPSLVGNINALIELQDINESLVMRIKKQLFNYDAIKALNMKEKELFIKLLLTKDMGELNKFCDAKNLINVSVIKNLTFKDVFEIENDYMNLSKKMIDNMTEYALKEKKKGIENRARFLQSVLKDIPNEKMSEKDKMEFLKDSFPALAPRIHSVAYDESLPAVQRQDMVTKIKMSEYRAALKSQLDYSDYVILTTGLLQSLAQDFFKKDKSGIFTNLLNTLFDKIEESYFNLNYEGCINDINEVCKLLFKKKMLSSQDVSFIKSSYKNCTEVNQDLNYSRRFYEARLGQYIVGRACDQEKLQSFQDLCNYLKAAGIESIPELSQTPTPEEVERTLNIIAELNWDEAFRYHQQLKKDSLQWKNRDRFLRPGFMVRRDEIPGVEQGESSLSMNLAGMKANAPNFMDFIAKAPIRNRTVDVNLPGEEGYSKQNQRNRSAFVASLSGHTFFFLAVLAFYANQLHRNLAEKGMSEDSIGKKLSKEFSNLLSTYAGMYAKRGYHSFHEVLDVLKEPAIAQFFKDTHKIEIGSLLDLQLLKLAQNDTLAYSKGISLKSALHSELRLKQSKQSEPSKAPIILSAEAKRQEAREKRLEAQRAEQKAIRDRQELEERLKKQREKPDRGPDSRRTP